MTPLEGFYRQPASRDGRGSWCRECADARAAESAKSDAGRARLRAYHRAYTAARRVMHEKACPGCGTVFTTSRTWQIYCSEPCNKRVRGRLHGLNVRTRLRVLNRDGWRCYLCGLAIE